MTGGVVIVNYSSGSWGNSKFMGFVEQGLL